MVRLRFMVTKHERAEEALLSGEGERFKEKLGEKGTIGERKANKKKRADGEGKKNGENGKISW